MRSHAFLFEGLRPDGCHWVIESGLQIHRKHIQLSVQENRIEKYFDEKLYTTPEDISRTPVPRVTWLRQGAVPRSNLDELKQRLRRCVGARLRNLKRRIANH